MKTKLAVLAATLLLWALTLHAQAQYTAWDLSTVAVGNQGSGAYPICNDFLVSRPIVVTQVGMFDSGGDGIVGSTEITVQLYQLSGGKSSLLLETATFDAANPGTLSGGYRCKPLARPVTLLPGTYTIAAGGYDQQNPELDTSISSLNPQPQITLNNGGGLIQFLGYALCTNNDVLLRSQSTGGSGVPTRFAAATFGFSAATLPAAPHAADYAALTAGVTSFPVDAGTVNEYDKVRVLNHYGSLAVLDERAFPVIVEPSGTRLMLEAAGTYNGDPNGPRCVAFAHEQWGHALNDGRGVLFENAIRWVSRKSNPSDIVIGLTTNLNANYFLSRGYQVRTLNRGMKQADPNPMPGCDVVVASFQNGASDRFATRLSEYIASGGGLVITFVPWRFVHLYQTPQPAFWRANALVQPFGLVFRPSLTQPSDFSFTNIQATPCPAYFDAFPAADLLRQDRLGQVQLDSLQQAIAMHAITYAVDGRPDLLTALTTAYSGTTNVGTASSPPVSPSSFSDVVTLYGNQTTTNRLGRWQQDGNDLVSLGERGAVEYAFNVPSADVYRLQIAGMQNLSTSRQTNFDLVLLVDGVHLGSHVLQSTYGTSGTVECLTPYLLSGAHTLRILWDNARSATQLRLEGLRVQTGVDPDVDAGGVKEWVRALVDYQSGMDSTNDTITSYVSPVCIEGRDPYLPLMQINLVSSDQSLPTLAPNPSPDGRWYANVPLANAASTTLRITYQNGVKSEVRNLQWLPANTLDGGTYTIRQGDSMVFIARPTGILPAGAKMQITVGTNQFAARPANEQTTFRFQDAGVYTVTGTYIPPSGSPQTGSVTVNVVAHQFANNPDCWVGRMRNWDLTAVPPQAVLLADSRLFAKDIAALPGGGQELALLIDQSEPRYVLSRLGNNGPILDSTAARGFNLWFGGDTYTRLIATNPDGSQLIEMLLVLSPVLPDLIVRLDVNVGGVIFADGTTSKTLTASDFDALGQAAVRFIRPAGAKASVCHSVTVLQGSVVVGAVQ